MRINKRLPTPGGDDGIWPVVLNEWGEQVREVVNDQDDRLGALEPLFPATQEAAAATQLAKLAAEAAAATAIERVTVALAPTDTQVADLVGTPASATAAALDSTYLFGRGVVDTVIPDGFSVLAFQNVDPAAPDQATRVYFLPRAGYMPDASSTSVGGDNKIFATDYNTDDVNYMDLGMYFHPSQESTQYPSGDRGTRGFGVFWFNSKVNGTYEGKSPDIGWAMQDGQYVAGRVALATVNGDTPNIQFVFGTRQPLIGTKVAVVAEFQGDIGMNADADTGIRWMRTDATTADNLFSFQRQASGGQVRVVLGSSQRLMLTNAGSLVLGNGSSAIGTTSTEGFLYLNSMAGTPTGTPTAQGAAVPCVIDTAGSKLHAYIGGAWKAVTFA